MKNRAELIAEIACLTDAEIQLLLTAIDSVQESAAPADQLINHIINGFLAVIVECDS